MPRLTQTEARSILKRLDIAPHTDFHSLYSGTTALIGVEANRRNYKRPTNASGSTARYFYAYLERTAKYKITLLATNPTLDGIKQSIANYWYTTPDKITVRDENVFNGNKPIPNFRVKPHLDGFKFIHVEI